MSSTSYVIPKTMRAAVVDKAGEPTKIVDNFPVTQPEDLLPGECLVKMEVSGVCHTDLHAAKGEFPVQLKFPLICGHEGVGRVVAIGKHTQDTQIKLGDRVGIKWLADSCLDCETCRKGFEQLCPQAKASGMTVDGTFSEYVKSWVRHVTPIPENVNSAEAAAILCAGLTVYRAVKFCNAKVGDWIVLPGAGGGLGHLAIQYAAAMGLRVCAVDTGAEKRDLCFELGAQKWVDFKESQDLVADIRAACGGLGAHAAVVTAANSKAYEQALEYLRPAGTLMIIGIPNDSIKVSALFAVMKGISILGSAVGNRQEAREALEIVSQGKVKCHYVVRPLSSIQSIYDEMAKGGVAGRIVLDFAN